MSESGSADETTDQEFLKAQASRLLRYCREQGWNEQAVMSGTLDVDLGPICDQVGRIVPEAVDFSDA